MIAKKWNFLDKNMDTGVRDALSTLFGISPLLSTIMLNRGLSDAADAKLFLDKSLLSIHSPMLLKGMNEACERIKQAQINHEKITVYGDYDVDGVTSTTLLVLYLRQIGLETDYYIPERHGEGYGVHKSAIEQIAQTGTKLVITVDTGITAVSEVEYAKTLGIDVIVTDHHSCKEELPAACAVINPKQAGCTYPFKELAGVGVAFKLISALAGEEKTKELINEFGDLVALGTVADVVSLMDENRAFVSYGIQKMQKRPLVGMKKVMDVARISQKDITAQSISFMIAPRINAAGRMGRAVDAVRLLLEEDPETAYRYAADLDDLNRERQREEAEIVATAEALIETGEYDDDEVLVLAHKNWHHGIIGIVASKIADKYNKPTILISLDEEIGKGSGRSVGTFNLFEALSDCAETLVKFGGHALAAGLTIAKDQIEPFRRKINDYANRHITEIPTIPVIPVDCAVSGRDFTIRTVLELDRLEPFGMDNRPPMLSLLRSRITSIRQMSNGKHIRLSILHDGYNVDVVGFSKGYLADELSVGDEIDVLGVMDLNVYNGATKVQMRLTDLRFTPEGERNAYITYDELQDAYRSLRGRVLNGETCFSKEKFGAVLSTGENPIGNEKAGQILEIFLDCGFLNYQETENQWMIEWNPSKNKVDIIHSDKYQEQKRMACYEQ